MIKKKLEGFCMPHLNCFKTKIARQNGIFITQRNWFLLDYVSMCKEFKRNFYHKRPTIQSNWNFIQSKSTLEAGNTGSCSFSRYWDKCWIQTWIERTTLIVLTHIHVLLLLFYTQTSFLMFVVVLRACFFFLQTLLAGKRFRTNRLFLLNTPR